MPMDGTYNLSPQTASSAPAAGYYALWQADSLSGSDGDVKTTWSDANGLVAGGSGVLTNSGPGGHKFVYVDGTHPGYSCLSPIAQQQPFILFVVAKADDIVNTIYLCGSTNIATGFAEIAMVNTIKYLMYAGNYLYGDADGAYGRTNWQVYSAVFNGESSVLYTNGTFTLSGSAGTNVLDGVGIGNILDRTFFWIGGIAEEIVYTNNLSSGDRQKTETYLGGKYGITIYH